MCEWCDDKKIKDFEILKGAAEPLPFEETLFLDLAICRTDRWTAGLSAWATVGGRRGKREPLIVEKAINYCPNCGRRLSLADASRKEDT